MYNRLFLLLLLCFSGQALAVDSIFVGGVRHTLTQEDFFAVGDSFQAELDVFGDYGQELIIDIALRVEGDAGKELPTSTPLYMYDAQLYASCSGSAIGQDSSYLYSPASHGELQLLINTRMTFANTCERLTLFVTSSMLNKDMEMKLSLMEGF
ncbi:hypothetical protein [Thalassomonas actiniarum]|uniref:Uncharacterized protein n=1 Tax=Thalassomonas actiniarum TaxID=485447 RepID=A0AAF0C3L2_9GAMM|nr:hypothetical protein [Thalassomonas actiniarum]WDD99083.1 hypothetical protein SG35_028350 [Thalassomonas actiniarum]